MGDGSLSQDEIDKLLQGADETPTFESSSGMMAGSAEELSPLDRETLADIFSNAFSQAEKFLGTLLSKNVRISNVLPESKSSGDISTELGPGSACLFTNLSGPINGKACLIFSMENGVKLASALRGGLSGGVNEDAQLETLKQGFTSVMGTITLQVGSQINSTFTGSPLEASISKSARDLILPDGRSLVRMNFNLNVDGVGTFKMNYVISKAMADDIVNLSRRTPHKNGNGDSGGMSVNVSQPFGGMQNVGFGMSSGAQVGIKGVSFPSLSTAGAPSGQTNLNLLMDVQMSLTVELGRTKMYIKDILGLGEGSIIELDKLAGEPVDLLVNGKLIAKGEVVVIDENFGVRVTDIVSPTDRIKNENK